MKTLLFSLVFVLSLSFPASAASLFSKGASAGLRGYSKSMNSEADAHAIGMYDAWGENMAYQIEKNNKSGIVVRGEEDNDLYHSDGVGNVTVKPGANVQTIINKTETLNSTIVVSPGRRKLP